MKIPILIALLLISPLLKVVSQSISISPDGSPPDSSAILDIQSTTKGLLIPRMTQEQRDSILTPALGLTIFQTDGIAGMYYYDGVQWTPLGGSVAVGDWPQIGDDIYNDNPGNIGIGTDAPEGKLHIKGASDLSQLIIDKSESQDNANPLICLRNSDGSDLMWISADLPENIFIGKGAGGSNNGTTGSNNTFIGFESGFSNVSGGTNTALGAYSLRNNIIGYNNTANGFEALMENDKGDDNTAIGNGALSKNLSSCQNTAIGSLALNSQSYSAGSEYVSGNTAIGYAALYANQPSFPGNGSGNTAIGRYSMISNKIGIDNTAVGGYSLYLNTSGYDNSALGVGALYSNTIGVDNTAIGRQALFYNTEGTNNTATGYKALRSNESGYQNTANGSFSLFSNLSGIANTAHGNYALYSNTLGSFNTAVGFQSLYKNTTGLYNVAMGFDALFNLVSGKYNVSIGYESGTNEFATNVENTINIGNQGYLNAASNQAFIGNLSTAWIGGQTTWFTYASDERVKKNVHEDVKGLDFISRLRPVTYNLDIKSMREITGNKDTEDYPEKYDIEKIKQSGFLAQEVEQAMKDAGYDFNGITIPKNEKELYTMSYSLFVVPLVKAAQELNAKVETLEKENTDLRILVDQNDLAHQLASQQQMIDELKASLDEIKKLIHK